jgi:hypothetical protein
MAERFLLVWLDRGENINRHTIGPIRREMEDKITSPRDDTEIDLWLDSPGGDAHAAYKLALMLRSAASTVRVVIPDFAKSAATLLAVAGDEIFMAPGADMGPLDAQMPDEGSVSGSISALNIAKAADEVARDAVEMAMVGGADLLAITGLSRAKTIDAMLTFSARFSEPLVSQLDPKVVHHAKQTLLVTAKYAEQLLSQTKIEGHDPGRVAEALVETFPTHGYVISCEEGKALGLPIRPLKDYEFASEVQEAHRLTEGPAGVIHFCRLEEAIEPPSKTKTPSKKGNQKRGGGSNGRSKNRGSARAKSNGSGTRSARVK